MAKIWFSKKIIIVNAAVIKYEVVNPKKLRFQI